MCGISGFVGSPRENEWHESFAMLTALLLTSQRRGRHATGFVSLTEPYRDRHKSDILTDKQPLPASRFIQQSSQCKSLRHKRSTMVLLHSRFATHGDSENPDNLHPFVSHDQNLYLVHNGVINNHLELIEDHRLNITGECDSESLIRLIEHHGNVADGIDYCLRHSSGSMAIAVMDILSKKLYLARNSGRPI